MNPQYPVSLMKKFKQKRTLENSWHMEGRPHVYGPATKDEILKVAEDQADRQEPASSRFIAAALKKRGRVAAGKPSHVTVSRLMRRMKFVNIAVEVHPTLTPEMMKER